MQFLIELTPDFRVVRCITSNDSASNVAKQFARDTTEGNTIVLAIEEWRIQK